MGLLSVNYSQLLKEICCCLGLFVGEGVVGGLVEELGFNQKNSIHSSEKVQFFWLKNQIFHSR